MQVVHCSLILKHLPFTFPSVPFPPAQPRLARSETQAALWTTVPAGSTVHKWQFLPLFTEPRSHQRAGFAHTAENTSAATTAAPSPRWWSAWQDLHASAWRWRHHSVFSSRGIDPYDKPNTIYVERHEPSGYSTVFRSTDFFQSRENLEVILEGVRDFQLRDKYMFATKVVVSWKH